MNKPLLFAALLQGLIFCVLSMPAKAEALALDRIVAVAGEEVILASELEAAIASVQQQLRTSGNPVPSQPVLQKQVLERMVLTRLQTQKAKRAGITVDDQDLNNALEMVAARNNMSVPEFREALARQGVDYEQYRKQMREDLLINSLRQREVDRRISISEQDIDLFLTAQSQGSGREYKLRQILISVPPDVDPADRRLAQAKAEVIRERIEQGEDFTELAIAESDGQQALEGGDLGWIQHDLLPTMFSEQIPNMEPGEVSPILPSGSGFHIVRLDDIRTAGKRQIAREVHARHILLQPNAIRDEAATEALALDIYAQLQQGADFTELAAQHSDDPGSANQGGDLGWKDPASFEPRFSSRIQAMDPKQPSEPFQTQFGWHIAEVLEWRERDTTELQKRNAARQALMQQRVREEYDLWLRKLQAEAYVEYRLGNNVDNNNPQPGPEPAESREPAG
ncbi:MAG: peptidylprolyl isomerase [Salinisphaeraceae bacterium]|nr:peptidylprolyl isomerase [Salinisphaeraceae bacterium]